MNRQLEELACLYVLDHLDPSERAVFEARLLREPDLATFVRDLESTLANGIRALPRRTPPSTVLREIEQRISGSQMSEASISSSAPQSPPARKGTIQWVNFARWGIAAAIAISLTTIAVQSLRRPAASPVIVFVGFDSNRNTFVELPLNEPSSNPDDRFIQLAALAANYWDKPADLPVKPNAAHGESRGYALFDPSSKQGFVAIEQLPTLKENQRYHLWIVDPASGKIHDAGILPLKETNRGLYSFALESTDGPASERSNFFVTIENTGVAPRSAEPRGEVVLGNRRI